MADTTTLATADNGSDATVAAERVVTWAHGFKGADAHIVYDYIPVAGGAIPGALNGVTIQWDHDDDGIADFAVHVRPGGTVTKTSDGFQVENPEPITEPQPEVTE